MPFKLPRNFGVQNVKSIRGPFIDRLNGTHEGTIDAQETQRRAVL
jgi:hypothetical protein